ncbi:F0F1 ATP synthase subunit B' [Rubellimicrobium sp. CFH 75288]|uniref:F0F1 ATP synthase subunit B' n=1 Tax=Rubellimicrobium sp. CFH 75288 TaxID=2697034 RepID=UPI00144FA0BE|nr:F0F1 ATP synthase subunit B' [Rubellimicrobium sp. CFH 75288]
MEPDTLQDVPPAFDPEAVRAAQGAQAVTDPAAPAVTAVDPTGQGGEGTLVPGALTPHEAEAAAGMPQLDPSTFGNQIFWLLVALVAIWLILSRIVVPRVGAILAARRDAVEGDLRAAERLRAQAAEAEAAYEKAVADARAEAGRIAAETRATIQAELAAALAEADRRIEAKSAESAAALAAIEADAQRTVDAVARDVARALVEALGGRPDGAAIDAAVSRQMGGV